MSSNIEQLIQKIMTDENVTPKEQLNLFCRFVKRLEKHGSTTTIMSSGRKALSASHKKRTQQIWQAKRLEAKHKLFLAEHGHLPLRGRRPKNTEY
jgi:hypothetical protein